MGLKQANKYKQITKEKEEKEAQRYTGRLTSSSFMKWCSFRILSITFLGRRILKYGQRLGHNLYSDKYHICIFATVL